MPFGRPPRRPSPPCPKEAIRPPRSHGRPRRSCRRCSWGRTVRSSAGPEGRGQASRAVLSGNTMFRAPDAAGQSSGDMTPQPASSACAELTSTWRKCALLESARRSSERMSGAAWLSASATMSKTESPPSTSPVRSAGWPRRRFSGRRRIERPRARLLALHLEGVPGDECDHGARDGHADGDGPQELVPGTVGGRVRLVRRCGQTRGDGGLQGGQRRIEVRLRLPPRPWPDRGLWRVGPPARNAPRWSVRPGRPPCGPPDEAPGRRRPVWRGGVAEVA